MKYFRGRVLLTRIFHLMLKSRVNFNCYLFTYLFTYFEDKVGDKFRNKKLKIIYALSFFILCFFCFNYFFFKTKFICNTRVTHGWNKNIYSFDLFLNWYDMKRNRKNNPLFFFFFISKILYFLVNLNFFNSPPPPFLH